MYLIGNSGDLGKTHHDASPGCSTSLWCPREYPSKKQYLSTWRVLFGFFSSGSLKVLYKTLSLTGQRVSKFQSLTTCTCIAFCVHQICFMIAWWHFCYSLPQEVPSIMFSVSAVNFIIFCIFSSLFFYGWRILPTWLNHDLHSKSLVTLVLLNQNTLEG